MLTGVHHTLAAHAQVQYCSTQHVTRSIRCHLAALTHLLQQRQQRMQCSKYVASMYFIPVHICGITEWPQHQPMLLQTSSIHTASWIHTAPLNAAGCCHTPQNTSTACCKSSSCGLAVGRCRITQCPTTGQCCCRLVIIPQCTQGQTLSCRVLSLSCAFECNSCAAPPLSPAGPAAAPWPCRQQCAAAQTQGRCLAG